MLRTQLLQSAAMTDQSVCQSNAAVFAPPSAARGWLALESIVLLCCGALLMSYFYGPERAAPGGEIGVPGNDSGYHLRMAAMLPEWGFVREFPWLRFVYFRNHGNDFVSHHVGFHVLLLPFVKLSEVITGDAMAGGRWAMCFFFGMVLMLFNLLLAVQHIRFRWFWVLLFLLLPHQFFMRHASIRAICPSLALMLLVTLCLFARRPVLTGLTVCASNLLYLGSVLFTPILVATYFFASALGPPGVRKTPWSLGIGGFAGWCAGVLAYPYLGGMLEFLLLQVFGTGLSPDIEVGTEWRPYEGVWWFAEHAGVLLAVWVVALVARVRGGPPLDARETTLLVLNFVFLLLTLKSRRFIEYWPVFGLLSAASLASPLLNPIAIALERPRRPAGATDSLPTPVLIVAVALLVVSVAAIGGVAYGGRIGPLLEHWQLIAIGGLFALVPTAWAAIGLRAAPAARFGAAAVVALTSIAAYMVWLSAAAGPLRVIQRSVRCEYDLPAIREMMAFIREHSQPGDVIFTDDWDIFPIFFYHNWHNHYVVGLDPKFTHERRPDLWERYVRVTRGNVPSTGTVRIRDSDGSWVNQQVDAELQDIREHFGARWVICDRDHAALARLLHESRGLAELVYPSRNFARARRAPFMVFRIRQPGEAVATQPASDALGAIESDPNGILYLSRLEPVSVEQGWGELQLDAAVEGGPLMLGRTRFLQGLGTHAPSRIEYRLPPGYEAFEATAGVDASQREGGSVILSVTLDGREAYRSPVLTASSPPVQIRIPLNGAQRLVLMADPTADGRRFDHVNWAGARLVKPIESDD